LNSHFESVDSSLMVVQEVSTIKTVKTENLIKFLILKVLGF